MNPTTRNPLSLAKRIQSGLNRHAHRLGYGATLCVSGGDKWFWISAKATVGGFESEESVAAMRTLLMRLGGDGLQGYQCTPPRGMAVRPIQQGGGSRADLPSVHFNCPIGHHAGRFFLGSAFEPQMVKGGPEGTRTSMTKHPQAGENSGFPKGLIRKFKMPSAGSNYFVVSHLLVQGWGGAD